MYTESLNNYVKRYRREKQKSVLLCFKKEMYFDTILPAVEKAKMPVATFFKKAIFEKIERDNLN